MSSPKMPAIYISKYNRFVDNVISRINHNLGKTYDPVRVKLQPTSTTNSKKTTKTKSKKRKTSTKKNNSVRRRRPLTVKNKMGELSIARSTESESREPAFILISKNGNADEIKSTNGNVTETIRANPKRNTIKKRRTNHANSKKNSTKNTNNNATKQNKKPPKARATLFGLSSIKRDGDVTVNMMTDHTTVKSNFILGPLTLRVEREIGRGGKRELKSATATTAEMFGRLNLRIVHGGAATLHSIRVLQPKQVRVESADNHEKTKEFLWKRSSHIASVVSQQLTAAARSMLKPPPSS